MSKRRVAGVMRALFGLPIGPASVRGLERRTADALTPIHALTPIDGCFRGRDDLESRLRGAT